MTGPSCIDNNINDCQKTAPGTARNTDSRRGGLRPPAPSPPPLPTSPVRDPTTTGAPRSPDCVPIGDCGAHSWCVQAKYVDWCLAESSSSCSSPFCKRGGFPVPAPGPAPAVPTPGPTPLPTSSSKRCVPTLEGFYSDPAVWGPTCDAQGQADVCTAPICRWEAALVQANTKRHHFLGTALIQRDAMSQ